MRNCILKFSFLFFLIFASSAIFAQSPSAHNQQLVLEVSTVTSKNFVEVKSALSGMTGITLLAFCEQNRCFLLSYDPAFIGSTDDIEKTVQQLHPSYKTKVRTNFTVSELIDSCNKFYVDTEPTSIAR